MSLVLEFKVKLNVKSKKIDAIYRNCNIPRPNCEGCKFKVMCDKIQKAIESVKEFYAEQNN